MKSLKDLGVKFIFVQVIVFVLLFTAVGYYLNPSDPLYLKSQVSPSLLLLLVLTLFYGFYWGVLSFIVELLIAKVVYVEIPIKILLWQLLNVLVAGEFRNYWASKLEEFKEKLNYYNDRIRRFATDSMILKVSHDQLEKHYLVKPVSIRSLMEKLKNSLLRNSRDALNGENPFSVLKQILETSFYVQDGELYSFKNDKFISI